MKSKNNFLVRLGSVLFFVGALLGILFFAGLTWPHLEANFYFGYSGGADTKLRLSCPHILTPQDVGAIRATITNKVDKPINPIIQTEISGPIMQNLRSQPSIAPGQTLDLKWDVSADDVAYGHLIMVEVYQFASYKTPTATGSCGTLYLFMPTLTGEEIYLLTLAISLIGIVSGLILWRFGSGTLTGIEQERLSGMVVLAGVIVLGILLGTLGQWLLGVLALALAVLMFVIQFSRRLATS